MSRARDASEVRICVLGAETVRVLIIEDETALREQLVGQLRAEGYAVDASGDGDEGLYLGSEYPIDVAVVDLGLPGLSGIDVIRAWRAADRGFPILILTARGRWQDKVAGLEAGADDYICKPFDEAELRARVRNLIQLRRQEKELKRVNHDLERIDAGRRCGRRE